MSFCAKFFAGFISAEQASLRLFWVVPSSTGWFSILFHLYRQQLRQVQSLAMADNNDVFRMLAAEDKLDGTNYPLWAYMMRHVLVAKGLWNIVKGNDTRPGSTNTGTVEDAAGS